MCASHALTLLLNVEMGDHSRWPWLSHAPTLGTYEGPWTAESVLSEDFNCI